MLALMRLLAIGAVSMGLLVGPALVQPAAAAPPAVKIKISNYMFTPATVNISAGGKVEWLNKGPATHTTTSDTALWDSGPLAPGSNFSFKFKHAGTFTYQCVIHPFMTGVVIVHATT